MTQRGFLSIEQLKDRYITPNGDYSKKVQPDGNVFREILEQKTAGDPVGLKFSKHAAGRLADRNITLTKEQMERLQDGARKAESKGIRDSLVLVDQLAFIVNIPNRTVVTAMDSTQSEERIFTNINGAVIM